MDEYKINIIIIPNKQNDLSFLEKEDKVIEYIKIFEKSVEENIGYLSVTFEIIEENKNKN